MAALIHSRLPAEVRRLVMVGDRASTDGAMAEAVGAEFAHVLTGVDDDRPSAGSSFRDLAAVVDSLLDSEERTDGG